MERSLQEHKFTLFTRKEQGFLPGKLPWGGVSLPTGPSPWASHCASSGKLLNHSLPCCLLLYNVSCSPQGSSEGVIVICYCWPPYLTLKDSPEFQNHTGPTGKQSWWCDSFRPVSQVPLLIQLKADTLPCGTPRMGSELRFEGHKELSSRIAGDKGAQIPR